MIVGDAVRLGEYEVGRRCGGWMVFEFVGIILAFFLWFGNGDL